MPHKMIEELYAYLCGVLAVEASKDNQEAFFAGLHTTLLYTQAGETTVFANILAESAALTTALDAGTPISTMINSCPTILTFYRNFVQHTGAKPGQLALVLFTMGLTTPYVDTNVVSHKLWLKELDAYAASTQKPTTTH